LTARVRSPILARVPPTPAPDRLARHRTLWVAALALLAYAGAVPSGFAFDDRSVLLESPIIQGTAPLSTLPLRDWWGHLPAQTVGSYRPLAVLSLWMDWHLAHGAAWWIHLVNVLLHALAMVLVYRVFRRIVPDTTAFAAALCCAVLAAPSEVVQGCVGRADLLETIGLVGGLAAHRKRGAKWALLAAGGFLLALGSKETGIMALAAWVAVDWLRPAETPARERLGRWALYAGVLALYLTGRWYAIGTLHLPRTLNALYNPLLAASTSGRIFGAGRIFLERYAFGLLDPRRRLYDCSAQACTASDPSDPVAWCGLLLFGLLLLSPLLLRRRSPVAAAGLAWGVVFLAPVTNFFVPATLTYGERLLYVPCIGLAIALAEGVRVLSGRRAPALVWGGFAAVLLVNAVSLQSRHLDWRSDAALVASGLRYGADSVVVQQNNATAAIDRKDYAAAEGFARRAVTLVPTDAYAHKALAVTLHYENHNAEAEDEFRQAIALERRSDLVLDFANFLARQHRFKEALQEVEYQARRDPGEWRLTMLRHRLEEQVAREAKP
jgi:tetratricopeptide (TPR) repeat protein